MTSKETVVAVFEEKSTPSRRVLFQAEPYSLALRTPFGTSHSTSTSRKNALISIQIVDTSNSKLLACGYGECGLPPKKHDVYLADFEDVRAYCSAFVSHVPQVHFAESKSYNPFHDVGSQWFQHARSQISQDLELVCWLFSALDSVPLNENKWSRVARNGIETALLDLWGQITGQPLYMFIGVPKVAKPCFYTVGLDDLAQMLESAAFGLKHTPYLKIKLNKDVTRCVNILRELKQFMGKSGKSEWKFSIDANADWTPEVSLQFLDSIIREMKQHVYMIEQPFPVKIPAEDSAKWIEVKHAYIAEGIHVFADESVATWEDIDTLSDFVDGINIKLDKTGGIREALKAISKAREKNLALWIGIMVSSRLSTTTAAALLPLSTFGGDLDGQLLVSEDSDLFVRGLEWNTDTGLVQPSDAPGLGLQHK